MNIFSIPEADYEFVAKANSMLRKKSIKDSPVNSSFSKDPPQFKNRKSTTGESVVGSSNNLPYSSSNREVPSEQSKKMIDELHKQLLEEVARRQKAQHDLKVWKERQAARQLEFRNIIAKFTDQKKTLIHALQNGQAQSASLIAETSKIDLEGLHHQIQQQIQKTNNNTHSWLESKLKDGLVYMEKRLSKLKETMREEIMNHKVLASETYESILREIEFTRTLATSIDEENKQLQKQIKELKLKNELLSEERNMVIQDLIEKKHQLRSSNKQSIDVSSPSASLSHRGVETHRAQTAKPNQRRLSQAKDGTPRFIGQPFLMSPRKLTKSTRLFDEQDQKIQNTSIMEVQRVGSAAEKKNPNRQQKSIMLLQKTLERERKKNFQLSSLFTRSSTRNQELHDILFGCIEQAKQELSAAGSNSSKEFHLKLLEKIAVSQKVIGKLNQMRDNYSTTMASSFRNSRGMVNKSLPSNYYVMQHNNSANFEHDFQQLIE